ncbi:MAG: hypothetical protein KAT34_03790 [Candidatus Aminicenantes bacterium]|nr:hypothetical protein [Candidatus Aminicenantes bacterium]
MNDDYLFYDGKGMKEKGDQPRETDVAEQAAAFILTRSDLKLSNLGITDAAAAVGTECAFLSQDFLLDRRITFERFVEREKLYRAAFAFEIERHITVGALSKRLGFATIRHFAKAFEDYFLIAPQRYQLLVRNRARYRHKNL